MSTLSSFIIGAEEPIAGAMRFSSVKLIAVALLFFGIGLRWCAIRTLKSDFSSTIRTDAKQRLMTSGIFSLVRHPSYLGSMVSFWGFNLFFENPLSFSISALLVFTAYDYRIEYEERMLLRRFGRRYREYADRTVKLIPFVY